jgi:hypothetical protein
MVKGRPVLGVDIGTTWGSTGSALLWTDDGWASVCDCKTRVLSRADGGLDAGSLADAIDRAARAANVAAVSLDGPQGWRDPASSCIGVGRHAELSARCPGKTGTDGICFPGTYIRWVRLCIDIFERLLSKPGVSLANSHGVVEAPQEPGYSVLECFPTSSWRASSLRPLPGHKRAPPPVVREYAERLAKRYRLPASAVTDDHDDLQATVAALVASAALGGPGTRATHGVPSWIAPSGPNPHRVEGLIWDSSLPAAPIEDSEDRLFREAGDARNPLLIDDRIDLANDAIERGVQLFKALAREASRENAIGVGYSRFVELVYGAPFVAIVGRTYKPSDSAFVIRLASFITDSAGGRISVTRGPVTINAGMDTFIWQKERPHDRSDKAWTVGWAKIPYTKPEWRAVFPDGQRRLVDRIP